jgi:hypothetical protein
MSVLKAFSIPVFFMPVLMLCGCNVTPVPPTGTYNLSGTVTGASTVYVQLTGTSSDFTSTASTGYYRFTGLASGYYIVTPSKTGYTFTPHSRTVTIASADATGIDFDVSIPPEE